ncbi:MAG: hypothetical protein AAF266_13430, partial [Planctomycetota bacterium]
QAVSVEASEGLISLSVRDASLRQVLAALAQTQNLNLIVAAPADLPVTAEFKEMPLREVLEALLRSTGHNWTENNGVIVVTSTASGGGELDPQMQGRRVAVIELDFASAADLQPAVEGLLSPVGQSFFVETNPLDNRRTKEILIVEDLDAYVARIEHYVAEADQAPRQVLIEVSLLQITLNDDQSCGVDFNALSRVSGANLRFGSTGAASAFDPAAMGRGFFIETSGGDLDSVLEAIISTTDAKALASPRLLALNGQTSRIQIGEEIGYLTNLSTQGGGVNQQQAEFLEVGVILEVTPRITRDGRVLMQVSPEVSTGAVNPLTNAPDKQTAEVDTNAMLHSGQGMIIGGLIQEEDTTRISRVPVLGSLPYVNPLFQRREVIKTRTELVVALVPHILPVADPEVLARNEADYFRARQRLTHGPLCRNPRPYEAKLYDPYRDERHCRVFDRPDPFCTPAECSTACSQHAGSASLRRLPPVAEVESASEEADAEVARRAVPQLIR